MPELMTAWVTLSATTRGMELDIKDAVRRAERGAKFEIKPKVDSSGLSSFRSSLGNLGGSAGKAFMGAFGGVASAAAFTALAATAARAYVDQFQDILNTGLDFSRTMNNFQGVTRASANEMRNMRNAARALGADTTLAGASASSAATAMTELAKAGFSVDQAMEAARGTLTLATAGQIDASKAAEIQANAMNAFGLGAESAAHTADLLANAAIASSADIPDIGLALQQVGGIAHGFGESLDDTVAALALFANAGIKGSDAGTLLKTTMQSITDQGNPAQGAIESLGLELYRLNAAGDKVFVGFRELFRQLGEAKKRMTSEDFQAFSNILFGSDAMRAAMLGNADAFDVMLDKMQRTGAASEMAAAQMQGLPGAVESFANVKESLQLSAFEAIGPSVTTAMNTVVEAMNENGPEIIRVFASITDVVLGLGQAIVHELGATAYTIGTFIEPFGDIQGAMLKFQAWQADIRGDDATAAQLREEAESFFNMGEGLKDVGEKIDKFDIGKLRDNIRETAENAATAHPLLKALGTTVTEIPDDKTVTIKDNSPEVVERLKQIGVQIEQTPTGLKLTATTDEAQRTIDAFIRSQGGKEIKPEVKPDLTKADADMRAFVDRWSRNITMTPQNAPPPVGTPPPPLALIPTRPHAGGGSILGPGGPTADRIPIWASNGEHMLSAADVAAMGGQGAVYKFRNALHRAGGGAIRGSKSGLQPNASQLFDLLTQAFPQLQEIGGVRADAIPDHPSGLALDIMIPGWDTPAGKALGDQINAWLQDNAAQLGMDSTIWQDFWKPVGGQGHRLGRTGANEGHYNHIHAKVTGGPATGVQFDSAASIGGYYDTPDPRDIREAEEHLTDREAQLAIQEQQLRELKADAKESQRMQQQADVEKAKREVRDAKADLEEARRGKYREGERPSDRLQNTGGGGMDATSFGEQLVSGLLQGIGLDGSVFSNPLEWPNVKSAFALANWGGGMLRGLIGGGGAEGPGSVLVPSGGGGGGAIPSVMLPNVTDYIPSPTAPLPAGVPAGAHGGTGALPGPSYVVNGNIGMDPRAVTQRFDAAHNQAWRRTMPAVRP